jgi:hypothetical protein
MINSRLDANLLKLRRALTKLVTDPQTPESLRDQLVPLWESLGGWNGIGWPASPDICTTALGPIDPKILQFRLK